MEINEKKNQLQLKAANLILDSPTLRNSAIIATGVGKSRIVILVLKALVEKGLFNKFLIVVDNTRLKNYNWKEEFIKWKEEELFNKVIMQTYQTVYKWNKDLSDTYIVCDEIDFAIGTPKYGQFFHTYKNNKMLGLTGYVAEHKEKELNDLLPILVKYSYKQGVKDGILNEVNFVLVKYDLNKNKNDIKITYTKNGVEKTFTQSENKAYEYAEKTFIKAYQNYQKALLNKALFVIKGTSFKTIEKRKDAAVFGRMRVLFNGVASLKVVKDLKDEILSSNKINKIAIFSKITKQLDKLTNNTYHTKNSQSVNEVNYSNFNKGISRELGLVAKINRGVNMVGLNTIIMESYDGSDTVLNQRKGRSGRLDVKEIATIYILMPYYMKKNSSGTYDMKPTQMVTWAYNMLKGHDISKAKIIDLRTIKNNT